MKEGVDYELIPASHTDYDQAWNIRILTGDFIETVLEFGTIAFDGKKDRLTFNFIVQYSPQDVTANNLELQEVAGDILFHLLEDAAKNGSLGTRNLETDE